MYTPAAHLPYYLPALGRPRLSAPRYLLTDGALLDDATVILDVRYETSDRMSLGMGPDLTIPGMVFVLTSPDVPADPAYPHGWTALPADEVYITPAGNLTSDVPAASRPMVPTRATRA